MDWVEDLQNIELSALLDYDNRYINRYIKSKIKTYRGKVYTDFCCLNVQEDGIECECFTIVSVDFLLVCEKKILSTSIFRQFCS